MTELPATKAVGEALRGDFRERPPTSQVYDLADAVRRYQSPLLRYATGLLRGHHDQAQDLVQEAFIRLHRLIERDGAASVRDLTAWLYRVVHNLAVDQARRKQSRDAAENAPRPVKEGETALGVMIREEACRIAMQELDNLPEPQRQLIMLKVMEGLTLRQIGEVTGMSVGNANYHLTQGLKELTRRLTTHQAI